MFENKDVFIFDLDGTLIDSLGMWNEVDRLLITFLGGDPLEETARQMRRESLLAQFCKDPDPYVSYCSELKKIYNSALSPVDIKKKRYEIAEEFLRNAVCLKPGAAELLHALKNAGKTLILASATSRKNVEIYSRENRAIYENAHFPTLFSVIYTRDDVDEMKPSPAVYEKALSALSVPPERCLAVEDSLSGVQAAHAAGLDVVCVYDKHSESDTSAIKEIATAYFSDCFSLLSALTNGK